LPSPDRVCVYIDGQNLYHLAKAAWGEGYHWPKYDPRRLAEELTALEPGRVLVAVRFYTGVPSKEQSRHWHGFWTAKLRAMESRGVRVFRGRILDGREKGVDVRIALDLVREARERSFDTAIVVSQDSDLNEAFREVLAIVREQRRAVLLESAFPFEAGQGMSRRGLVPSKWRPIDRAIYDRCADPRDYRPPPPPSGSASPATVEDLKRKYRRDPPREPTARSGGDRPGAGRR
jgi:uncharacterized LabA/DUF88 family protein